MNEKTKKYVSDNAQLMAEWDFEQNNTIGLDPHQLTHGSTKKAHWICSNKHKFIARIDHRTIMGSGCPYCAGKIPIIGENDLATTHPHLLEEWDYENNTEQPKNYTAGSNKKVNWICHECGNRWQSKVINRALRNSSCPNCMRIQRGVTRTKKTIETNGSLAVTFPKIADQWDYAKNDPLKPTDVHASSKDIVWWVGSCGHSWSASISNRVAGTGCPVCAGKSVLSGFNDLKTKFPEIADEWHPSLNGDLSPTQITAHNDKKVWWICPKCNEPYFTSIYSRTSLKTGCPVCTNRDVRIGINDLATTHPALAMEWSSKHNGNLRPTDVVAGSNKTVWWECTNGHEWQAAVATRISGCGCPICAKEIRPVTRQKTYLAKNGSLAENRPEIAAQWHPEKNGSLTPYDITAGSDVPVWWICEKGHEWEATVSSRRGCPYCNNEHNSSFPEQILYYYLAKVTQAINRYKFNGREIDIYLPELNIGVEYNGRYYHKNRKQQDIAKYDFFKKNGIRIIVINECDFKAVDGDTIYYPYKNSDYLTMDDIVITVLRMCSLPIVDVDIKRDRAQIFENYIFQEKSNSLAEKYPWLIDEWDYEKNGKLTPWLVSYGSNKRIHWICQKCRYRWEAVASSRKNSGCPCCANRAVVKGLNDLCTTHPQLALEWDDDKNEKKAEHVVAGSHQYAWWKCENGHVWKAQIKSRAQGCGCPKCAREKRKSKKT